MKTKKITGWFKVYRAESETLRSLSDQEYRLYFLYLQLMDWDHRHKVTYRTFEVTVRAIRELYLPAGWSIGKISRHTNSLEKKGFIKRLGRSTFFIPDLLRQPNVTEQDVPIVEQTVPPIEQTVQSPERSVSTKTLADTRSMLENKGVIHVRVPTNEQLQESKETKEN